MNKGCSRYYFCLFGLLLLCYNTSAQMANVESSGGEKPFTIQNETGKGVFMVRNIMITGNRKTKPLIILREMPFASGDAMPLQDLVGQFEHARRLLMNTALFQDVQVTLKSIEDHDVDVQVTVKERWYLFPMPYFRPVDRNLKEWIVDHNASINRVNYGVMLIYNNASGFNDKLQVELLNGLTKQFTFRYDRLYIDHRLKWGANIGFGTGDNREVNYKTINNRQAFLKDNGYVHSFTWGKAEAIYRPAIKTTHRFGLAFSNETVKDTVLNLNPDYFKSKRNSVTFAEVSYGLTYLDLDYNPYPTKGYAAEFHIMQRGFNKQFHVFQINANASAYWHVARRSFMALSGFGILKAPFHQPFFSSRVLGYGDFMQGYEYYVVDGVAAFISKLSFVHELFSSRFRTPKVKGIGGDITPLRIFGKIYSNAGYVYNENPGANSLPNKVLFSGGIGLDILTFYDYTIKLEWTFNQLGQNGLFLHRKSIF